MSTVRLFLRCCFSKKKEEHLASDIKRNIELEASKTNNLDISSSFEDTKKNAISVEATLPKDGINKSSPHKNDSFSGSEFTFVKDHLTLMEHQDTDTVISADMEASLPSLKLKVLESKAIPVGTIINITAAGYNKSLRKARDGKTFFGVSDQKYGVDYTIATEQGLGRKHFVITFSLSMLLIS